MKKSWTAHLYARHGIWAFHMSYTSDPKPASLSETQEGLLLGKAPNLTIRDVVPVRGQELEVAQLDDAKELVLVPLRAAEWGEATQQDVQDHAGRPHVHLQPVTCAVRQRHKHGWDQAASRAAGRAVEVAAPRKREPLPSTQVGFAANSHKHGVYVRVTQSLVLRPLPLWGPMLLDCIKQSQK